MILYLMGELSFYNCVPLLWLIIISGLNCKTSFNFSGRGSGGTFLFDFKPPQRLIF